MWASTGRSGYGNSTIGGDYDSWDGLSMNGKQYRNEATMETRDLSGADYWHMRKQNRPTEQIPVSLHMLNKDRANIDAYAALDEPVKKATSISLADRVLPQQRTLTKLISQIVELEQAKKAGTYTQSEYDLLRDVLFAKKQRAERLLAKARSQKPINTESRTISSKAPQHTRFPEQIATFSSNKACTSAVQDAILFITGSAVLLIGFLVFF